MSLGVFRRSSEQASFVDGSPEKKMVVIGRTFLKSCRDAMLPESIQGGGQDLP